MAKIRELYDLAISFSFERKRDVVSKELIKFSRENKFNLTISERELRSLINGKQYEIIDAVIRGNALYKSRYKEDDF